MFDSPLPLEGDGGGLLLFFYYLCIMIEEYQLRVIPQVAYSEENIKKYLADEKGLDIRTLHHVRVLKKSIDARQRQIYFNLKVRAYINEFPQDDEYVHTEYPDV